MSAQTKAAVELALRAHVADEDPGTHVDAYVLIASTQSFDTDGVEIGYSVFGADQQPSHVSQGLAGHLSIWIQKQVQRAIGG